MKNRIIGFIRGKTVKIREKTGKKIRIGRKLHDEVKIVPKDVGLNQSLPTAMKSETRNYLTWLEQDKDRFDSVALRSAKDLKALYFSRGRHTFPRSARTHQILFKKEYPADSRLSVFKKIIAAETSEAAAKLIVENKVPYSIAVGLVDKITPSVLAALVNSMTSQEIITNIASLEEKGAMDNPNLKKLIEEKLEQAKKASRISSLKSKTAVRTGRVKDEELVKKLDSVADVQIKKAGSIKISTAVFVDRSGSMSEAIDVGKRVSALISGVTESDLFVVAFDNTPQEVKSTGKTLTDWEKAFLPIRTGGYTSIGCALTYLLEKKMKVEQIVVITDEGENAKPLFSEVYPSYVKELGISPHVVIIHVGSEDTTFRDKLQSAGISYDVYTPNAQDYYGLPGLVTLLSRKSKLDLVMEIMDTPLLKRGAIQFG
jgi:hypothetical protein